MGCGLVAYVEVRSDGRWRSVTPAGSPPWGRGAFIVSDGGWLLHVLEVFHTSSDPAPESLRDIASRRMIPFDSPDAWKDDDGYDVTAMWGWITLGELVLLRDQTEPLIRWWYRGTDNDPMVRYYRSSKSPEVLAQEEQAQVDEWPPIAVNDLQAVIDKLKSCGAPDDVRLIYCLVH